MTIEAANGCQALEKLAVYPVAIMITDTHMPEMGGFELIRRMRTLPSHRSTPVVVISSEAPEHWQPELAGVGVSDWIMKSHIHRRLGNIVMDLAVTDALVGIHGRE